MKDEVGHGLWARCALHVATQVLWVFFPVVCPALVSSLFGEAFRSRGSISSVFLLPHKASVWHRSLPSSSKPFTWVRIQAPALLWTCLGYLDSFFMIGSALNVILVAESLVCPEKLRSPQRL